jgi:hypothetical protein
MFEQPLYCAIVNRVLACIDDTLQEKVRLLQLVEEEVVYLSEFESAEVLASNHLCTHHVATCKEPAKSR